MRTTNDEQVSFTSSRSSGAVELEGRLHVPGAGGKAPGVVVCHPHPAGGGEMGVGLIRYLAEEFDARGAVVLRFNFGGVGMSGGSFTDGLDEPLDVAAAFDYVKSLERVDAEKISVVGWSFGAWVSLLALADGVPAVACAAIAPPLMAVDWAGQAPRLALSAAERYYVVGDRDQFCRAEDLREFAAMISQEDAANVRILAGVDHFLFGTETEVVHLVADLLSL